MGYTLYAFIARPPVLESLRHVSPLLKIVRLEQSFALMPLPYNVLDSIPGYASPEKVEGFTYLKPRLTELALEASKLGAIAYVEVDFFGGVGTQAAIAWQDGTTVFGPTHKQGIGPVNQVLKTLGVEHLPGAYDQFESVGLMRLRDTAYWYQEASSSQL